MPTCDHVALLVRSLERTLAHLAPLGLPTGPIEDFPGEGTREVYLGADDQPGRLLLLQALGTDGPYTRALAKRGPGLHHVAFTVADARAFVGAHPGWLLLPHSLDSHSGSRTLWLGRPGVGTLVEVHHGTMTYAGDPVVERLEVCVEPGGRASLVTGLSGSTEIVAGAGRMRIAGQELDLRELVDHRCPPS
jgi:methylmalonyl-CoA/ethylmalonyl-CoA epimerase